MLKKNNKIAVALLTVSLSVVTLLPTASAQSEFLIKFKELREKFQASKPDDQKKSLKKVEEELAKNQDPADKKLLLMAKALLALDQYNYAIAEDTFKELLKEKHSLTEYAHYYYGMMQAQQQKWAEAKIQFKNVLDLSPNTKLLLDSQFQLGLIALEEKKYKEAKDHFSKLERRQRGEESYPETIYQLAKAERGLFNKAPFCKWVRKLYSKYPQHSKVIAWGPDLAADDFEGKSTDCQPSWDDRKTRIRNLQWASLSQKAQAEIQSLRLSVKGPLKYEVDRLDVAYQLHEGDVTKALALLLPYYESRKKDFGYLMALAVVSARAGEVQLAVGSYYSAYKLNPRSKKAREALYQSAFLSYQFQDYDGAARKFEEFISKYSTSGLSRDAKWQLAWIKYLKGDFDGAYKSMNALNTVQKKNRRTAKSYPKDRVNYWMAMSLFRQGKYDQAKTLFESLAKDNLVGYYSIASRFRLKKIDALQPKLAKGPRKENRMIARFSMGESTIPLDENPANSAVDLENETEESISSNAESEEEMALDNSLASDVETTASDDSGDDSNGDEAPKTTAEAVTEEGPVVAAEKPTTFANPVLVKRFERARDLMILGLNDWAKWDLFDIERKTRNKDYLKTLMGEYQTVENYHRSAYIGQIYFGSQRALHGIDGVRYVWEYTYPRAYADYVEEYSKKWGVPQELIWGIMRAESSYKKDAISPVGALGLMQVMPSTGKRVSELIGDKNFEGRKLLEPEAAVRIGSRYLQRLMTKFDQNVALTAASYNAGPHRVRGWLASFGTLDVDEFVEHIPFLETRNYVKKVISNYYIYSQLYSKKKEALAYLSEPLGLRFTDPVPTKETWDEI